MLQSTLTIEAMSQTMWDAVVIGAGPAGSLVAHQLASGGARVLLVEKKAFPRDKVCGACLNGQALSALVSSGLIKVLETEKGYRLDRFCLRLHGRELSLPLPRGYAISRSRLDLLMAQAAINEGAHFGAEVEATVGPITASGRSFSVSQGGSSYDVEAKVVIVAAGLANHCVDDLEIQTRIDQHSRIGLGCDVNEFPDMYSTGTIFMAVGSDGYVGLVRVEGGRLNVAAALSRSSLKQHGSPGQVVATILNTAGFPAISALNDANWKGTPPLTRRTTPLALPRLFLIGDASGYVEPFTGEGMGWALCSAMAVVPILRRAILHWGDELISEWSCLHTRIIQKRQRLCRFLALSLRYPGTSRIVLEAAGRIPQLSRYLINHMNDSSFQPIAS
jgi:flavin-dependent dehydrogenase